MIFDGTLLFVSHDRYFINRVATQVLELSEEGSTLYLGDYDYYLEKKAELEALLQHKQKLCLFLRPKKSPAMTITCKAKPKGTPQNYPPH